MAPLVGDRIVFAAVKIGLTAGGVVMLTQLARIRAFGRISVGVLLYTVLAIYSALIVYEFRASERPVGRAEARVSLAGRLLR